jgi:hypothetical protein
VGEGIVEEQRRRLLVGGEKSRDLEALDEEDLIPRRAAQLVDVDLASETGDDHLYLQGVVDLSFVVSAAGDAGEVVRQGLA